jgi:hypothetical protein
VAQAFACGAVTHLIVILRGSHKPPPRHVIELPPVCALAMRRVRACVCECFLHGSGQVRVDAIPAGLPRTDHARIVQVATSKVAAVRESNENQACKGRA